MTKHQNKLECQLHLLHITTSSSDQTNSKEEVVVGQELLSRLLHLVWESCREHQSLAIALGRLLGHVFVLHHLLDLWHEAHVQHPVGLIQDQEVAMGKRYPSFLYKVVQPAREPFSKGKL